MKQIRLSVRLVSILSFSILALACSRTSSSKAEGDAAKQSINFQTAADEFIYNGRAEPDSLDPQKTWAHDSAQIIHQLYEGLITREPDFMTLRPGLASEWTISTDGLTYTFTLRPGVKWSNGEPLTAEQVKGSFIRALDPKLAAPYVRWYTDFIVGANELSKNFNSSKRAEFEKSLGIIANGNIVTIKLIRPLSYFKYLIAQPPFFVVHPSMYDTSSPAWTSPEKFISNGAYNLSSWKVNDRIVLEKNPNFFEADAVPLKKVVIVVITDENASFNMYQSGKLDWTNNNAIASTMVPGLKGREDFHMDPTLGTYMYVFNTRKKPFNDVKVRRAFQLTVDQPTITDRVLRSGFMPTHRLIPPVIPGYQSLVSNQASMEERIKEAKKLLAEAGYPDGKGFPTVTYRYNTDEGHHKIAQALQAGWQKNLGISVKLENLEWKVFLSEQAQGRFDLVRKGWIGDYPDPNTFLEIFMSHNENNHSGWSNSTYDQLIEGALKIEDEKKRYEAYAQAEKLLFEESPFAAIYHYSYFSLLNPAVKGFIPNPQGLYLLRYFSKK